MPSGRLLPEHERAIQRNFKFLLDELDASKIVDILFEREVISFDDHEQILQERVKVNQNRLLLGKLLKAGPDNSFDTFVKSLLKEFEHVEKRLIETVASPQYKYTSKKDMKKENEKLKKQIDEINQKHKEEKETLMLSIQTLKNELTQKEVTINNLKTKIENLETNEKNGERQLIAKRDTPLFKPAEKKTTNISLDDRIRDLSGEIQELKHKWTSPSSRDVKFQSSRPTTVSSSMTITRHPLEQNTDDSGHMLKIRSKSARLPKVSFEENDKGIVSLPKNSRINEQKSSVKGNVQKLTPLLCPENIYYFN